MVIIRGNSSKSRVTLDVDFDSLVLENTVTGDTHTFEEIETTHRSGLYYRSLIDFSGLELGEYKYLAYLGERVVQSGLLTIEPFDESEEPVQVITPVQTRKIITYQN